MSMCQICMQKSQAVRPFEDGISLHKCLGCEAEFLWPQPNDERLSAEYKKYFSKRETRSGSSKSFYFEKLLNDVNVDLNNKSILEIGGAEGDFARAILKKYIPSSFTVLEMNDENRKYFTELGCKMVNRSVEDYFSEQAEKFDIIFFFDVLEHLRSPDEMMKKFSKHLNPGGSVIASFPNSDSISRKMLGCMWPQYKLEHLFYFSRKSVEILAQNSSLKIIELRPLAKKLPIDYLCAVGKNFGPNAQKAVVGLASYLIPGFLSKKSISLKFGEWLLIAEKKSS